MRLLDLFSGIGGFHLGFKRAGFKFDYVGFAEVDKYASAVYKYNNPFAKELGDVKSIRSENLPKIDIITFGSPCQDFSIASKRAGLNGTRSSLIWEAIRLITECKPRIFVWENVKGTFSSNNGADFWAIIQAFTNIGSYRLEWQLLNTCWFPRTPQNRERIYLVGYIGDRGGRSVFPIGETSATNGLKVKLNQIGTIGKDSEATRVYNFNGIARTLTDGGGMGAKTGLYLVKDIKNKICVSRLTPVECNGLQGFSDNYNEFGLLDGKKVAISDTQRYKQAGNAVTVDVVAAVARKIKEIM